MNQDQPDPIFASSLHELKWILAAWLIYFLWVIGYCGAFGYEVDPDDLGIVMGMPSWVFWGIVLPWIFATSFTAWFAMVKMKDHPLPESQPARSNESVATDTTPPTDGETGDG